MKMFHQKVKEIKYHISSEPKIIENFDQNQSLVLQKIGEFIYQTDNIYLATSIRKIWQYTEKFFPNFELFLNILKTFNQKRLLNINFLEEVIYSSVIVSPNLMMIYYKNFLSGFHEVLQSLIMEIEEKENDDSFKIAQNIKTKIVVINNILDYLKEEGVLELMKYSGTPLPGGKSFIILKLNKEKFDLFKNNFLQNKNSTI